MKSRFWNQIQVLCGKRKTTPTKVVKEIGLSTSMVTRWKAGTIPNNATLQKLAAYFSVTPDYLLGYDNIDGQEMSSLLSENHSGQVPSSSLADRKEEQKKPAAKNSDGRTAEFIELFQLLSKEQQRLVISQIKGILADQE